MKSADADLVRSLREEAQNGRNWLVVRELLKQAADAIERLSLACGAVSGGESFADIKGKTKCAPASDASAAATS